MRVRLHPRGQAGPGRTPPRPGDGTRFYRPLGEGIEFRERTVDAARREIREELGVELAAVTPLGVLENVFDHVDRPFHEICFVFDPEPEGWSIERFDGFAIAASADSGCEEIAVALDIAELVTSATLYPDGVPEPLRGAGAG